jgi:hypothetical protein
MSGRYVSTVLLLAPPLDLDRQFSGLRLLGSHSQKIGLDSVCTLRVAQRDHMVLLPV